MSDNIDVVVIGAGPIAQEYIKILLVSGINPIVVARSQQGVNHLREMYPELEILAGGIEVCLPRMTRLPSAAIVATQVQNLASITEFLLRHGIRKVLVEKPLSFSSQAIRRLSDLASANEAEVFIAYNRRNYVAVREAQRIIMEDGGVSSFYFDFTEAIHRINPDSYDRATLLRWGIANSSHVIDTAFYLGGEPQELNCSVSGNSVSWHPSGSIFTGSGKTVRNVPFSYHANWGAPGRWSIEINTPQHKLLFSPMERLRVQNAGSFAIEEPALDYSDDIQFKPGFKRQTLEFINGDYTNLVKLELYRGILAHYMSIFAYSEEADEAQFEAEGNSIRSNEAK